MKTETRRHYALLLLIVLAGCILRLWKLEIRGQFWLDECALGVNVMIHDLRHLLTPMILDQAAPAGYLAIVRLMADISGYQEWAMRLPSLIAGVLALPLVYLLGTSVETSSTAVGAGLYAATMVALSPLALYYSAEMKPYSVDLLLSSVLLLLAIRALKTESKSMVALGFAGVFFVWFSLPSIFVTGGIALALLARSLYARDRARTGALLVWSAAWLASFAAHYLLFVHLQPPNPLVVHYLGKLFAPAPLASVNNILWYAGRLKGWFAAFFGNAAMWIALPAMCWGTLRLARKQPWTLAILLSPLVLMLIASGLHKYSTQDRLVLFLLPSFAVIVSEALAAILFQKALAVRLAGAAVAVLLFVLIGRETARGLSFHREPFAMENTLVCLRDRWQPGDRLYVDEEVDWPYDYYSRKIAMDFHPAAKPPRPGVSDSHKIGVEVERSVSEFSGSPRIWLLFGTFPTVYGHPRSEFFRKAFDRDGRLVQTLEVPEARLYLYNLNLYRAARP